MALFRPKFQIPSLTPCKEYEYYSTFLQNPSMRFLEEQTARFSWFARSEESKKSASKDGAKGCGKPTPSRVELCRGSPSKCLEDYDKPVNKSTRRFFKFKKEAPIFKQKPSNCKEVEKPVERLSFWEQIFGADPKRSWPDPCTCRLAYRRRKKCEIEDPRLRDPRYRATEGDVLIYTEFSKCHKAMCMEPQPKPPPGFKLPKAVLCRMMVATGKIPESCEAAGEVDKRCKDSRMALSERRIPYEEMRPPERRRRIFTCREGIHSEDIIKPFNKESMSCGMESFKLDSEFNYVKKDVNVPEKSMERNDLEGKIEKRSRIEQLKLLIQRKDTSDCISSVS